MIQESGRKSRNRRSKILLVLTSIYGLLYILFLASGSYGSGGSEPIVVNLLFLLFLAGYAAVWLDERIGGVVFVLWWAGMWYLGLVVSLEDGGNAVVMGAPLFVLGISFIVSWYRRREAGKLAR
jgi:hypothetical protein